MTQPPNTPGSGPDWGDMKGKVSSARGPDLMILVGGLVLLVSSFLPWISVCFLSVCASASAWNAGLFAWLGVILGVAAAVITVMKMANMKVNIKDEAKLFMILGIASFALILLRFVTNISHSGFGLYIGLVAAAVIAYAGFTKNKGARAV